MYLQSIIIENGTAMIGQFHVQIGHFQVSPVLKITSYIS